MGKPLALACDHSGLEIKEEIKKLLSARGHAYVDYGTESAESCDYARYGYRAARAVAAGVCEKGIVICGTGAGISLACNKVKGIRCALCGDPATARLTKQHTDANMIALGARIIGAEAAKMIVEAWLDAEFEGGRHQRRVGQIHEIENGAWDGGEWDVPAP